MVTASSAITACDPWHIFFVVVVEMDVKWK